jgi:hypothetical protein
MLVEVMMMAKYKKDPSKAGVSAASVKGNAGPRPDFERPNIQGNNMQYKKGKNS